MSMLLNKTDKAHAALRDGQNAGLSLQERRVLILTDGRRTLNAVMAMLGPDILPSIHRLMRDGYIGTAAPAMAASRISLGGTVAGLLRAAAEAVQPPPAQAPGPTSAATPAQRAAPGGPEPPPPARSGTRRSLVAAKMYMLDMLQLQRDPEAIELRAEIQCTVDADALATALVRALHVLERLTPPSYSQRVAARLAEILPEGALPRLAIGDGTAPLGRGIVARTA
jgi:hypothetical protein